MPIRTETIAAEALPAYIAALPRLRAENLIIGVTKGTVPDGLELNGFYGPGRIYINGQGSAVNGGVMIYSCLNPIELLNFDIQGKLEKNCAFHSDSRSVWINGFVIDGQKSKAQTGILCGVNRLFITGSQIRNFETAIYIENGITCFENCEASGNTTGVSSQRGAIVFLSGTTPETLGGVTNSFHNSLVVHGTKILS